MLRKKKKETMGMDRSEVKTAILFHEVGWEMRWTAAYDQILTSMLCPTFGSFVTVLHLPVAFYLAIYAFVCTRDENDTMKWSIMAR